MGVYLPVGIQSTSAERILSTALDLFAVKGYDATSVREICEAAGITKPTLYHFFGSKDGVLQALVQTRIRAVPRAWWTRPWPRRDRSRQRVKVLARSVFESARSKPLFWRFIHSVIWAPPARRCRRPRAARSSTTAWSARWPRPPRKPSRVERSRRARLDVRMLILMGAISEAATGYVIAGKPELTPELADRNRRHDFRRMGMTWQRYENGTHFLRPHSCVRRRRRRLSRCRARRRWPRRSRPTRTVKLSLEQVALLEGRIVEAKADALPDITWNTFAVRSRDPGSA